MATNSFFLSISHLELTTSRQYTRVNLRERRCCIPWFAPLISTATFINADNVQKRRRASPHSENMVSGD